MLERYKDTQSIFYNYITRSFMNNKISHAYLIETNGVSYANELAISLAKFLVCNNEYDDDICKLIDNNSYPGFKIIDSDGEIKKEEILELQKMFSLRSVDNRRMVYLIKDTSKLNKHSNNSLLKFLEEPCDNIVAILMCDNVKKVMSTISSRCQIISLIKEEKFDYKTIFDVYYDESFGDYDSFVDKELTDYLDFYEKLEFKGTDILVFDNPYVFNNRIKSLLLFGLYLYFDMLNSMLERENDSYLPSLDFVSKVLDNNEINDIIKKIDVINQFLIDVKYNVNANLFMDNFIISMGGN